jgi:DNA topoisomerase-2
MSGKYEKLTHQQHVLKLPETYIGSIEESVDELWYYCEDTNKMIKKPLTYIPGEFKIFDELIVNALDQYTRCMEKVVLDPKTSVVKNIKVNFNKETGEISVYNDGEGICVEMHEKEQVYVPELIFGSLLTSSNYTENEKKHVGGKNGYGAKLTNIFSKVFTVETGDNINKKNYKQIFYDNMTRRDEPIITPYKGKGYTQITYTPDYSRFNSGLTDDMIKIIKKRTYDMAACTDSKVSVFLNDEKLEYKNFEKYTDLYIGSKAETPRAYDKPNQRWEIVACLNPNLAFEQISFVNGIYTYKGGKHVDYIMNQISRKLSAIILKKRKINVKPMFIRENIMVFIKSVIDNPSFNSQTKECLMTNATSFGTKCEISDKFIDNLSKCGIIERALELSSIKDNKDMKKSDGKKQNRLRGVPKLEDANWAGGAKSAECTLILTEGDSAKTMAMTGLGIIGRNKYGIFPLKGKLLNVRDIKNITKLLENDEINNIKKIMGLQANKMYSNISELRYGRILVLTDQDEDGSHIKGLLFNLFQSLWPTLFKYPGFLTGMLTPIVKAKKGKESIDFYSVNDYETWKEKNNDGKGYMCKYYKGLGTSTPIEAKEYFKDFKLVTYTGNEGSDIAAIQLAFSKTLESANHRKEWLSHYNPKQTLDYTNKNVSINQFVHEDLIHFSNSDNGRSLPSGIDGLKPSQRKVLYGCIKRKLVNEIRVAQLAGYISEHCSYHHGEASLQGTIINMAQNYVGSNNINLLEPVGQFGSRILGGKDSAQPRYIHTHLSDITGKIFNKLDNPVYTYTIDDGMKVEPVFYVPVISNLLVNGSQGIGTGWATDIPQHNPLDIIRNIRKYMKGEQMEPLSPWYRGFEGSIMKDIDSDNYISKGKYEVISIKGTHVNINITELPIGTWTDKYKDFLESIIIDKSSSSAGKKQYIKNFISHSTDTKVLFEIEMDVSIFKDISDFHKTMKLVSNINTSNMVYYNSKGKITKANSALEILEQFIGVRLEYYTKRKNYLLEIMSNELSLLELKIRFIMEFIQGTIIIMNKNKNDIESQLIGRDYPKMYSGENDTLSFNYLLKMPIYNLSEEKIKEFKDSYQSKKNEYDILISKNNKELWTEDLDELETFLRENNYTTCKKLIKKKINI